MVESDLISHAALAGLKRGDLYRRADLHALGLGGERQRGISYPAKGDHALLFSNPDDSAYGYSDGWADSKNPQVYRYSGMWFGQGPMTLEKGNAAIIDRSPNLHLFIRSGDAYRYEGRFTCTDVHQVRASNAGTEEAAFLFDLQRVSIDAGDGTSIAPVSTTTRARIERRPVARGPAPTISASSLPADPEQRRIRLEKSLQSHHDIVQRLAELLEKAGATCSEDPDSYDLLAEWPDESLLIEAKSLHASVRSRLRYAIGQLFEYRYSMRSDLGINPHLAIATDRPIPDTWLAKYLIDDLRITLIVVGPIAQSVAGPQAKDLVARVPSLAPAP